MSESKNNTTQYFIVPITAKEIQLLITHHTQEELYATKAAESHLNMANADKLRKFGPMQTREDWIAGGDRWKTRQHFHADRVTTLKQHLEG